MKAEERERERREIDRRRKGGKKGGKKKSEREEVPRKMRSRNSFVRISSATRTRDVGCVRPRVKEEKRGMRWKRREGGRGV